MLDEMAAHEPERGKLSTSVGPSTRMWRVLRAASSASSERTRPIDAGGSTPPLTLTRGDVDWFSFGVDEPSSVFVAVTCLDRCDGFWPLLRLFDVLSGDRPFDGGELVVGGTPVSPRSPYDMIRRGVVLVPADRLHALLPQRSLRENLASALYNRIGRWFAIARDEDRRVAERRCDRYCGGGAKKIALVRFLHVIADATAATIKIVTPA